MDGQNIPEDESVWHDEAISQSPKSSQKKQTNKYRGMGQLIVSTKSSVRRQECKDFRP